MRYSNRIYGIAGTLLLHALLLMALLFGFMHYPTGDLTQWPPASDDMIEAQELEPLYAAGDFVRTGDNLEIPTADDTPAASNETVDEPAQPGADAANSGVAANPAPALASKEPSPAKVKEEKKGHTKEEIAAEKAKQEAARQEQARKTADDATRRAFGRYKDAAGSGKAGQAAGNSASGDYVGLVGSGVTGRSLERWTTVRSTKTGKIVIRVTVDPQGKVTSASYSATGSSGSAAADVAMRRRCEEASRKCQFSRAEGSKAATGTIIWNFR